MAWNTIRKASAGESEGLDAKAREFGERHGWQVDDALDLDLRLMVNRGDDVYARQEKVYCRGLWLRVVRRYLSSPSATGIAYGCVGYHVD